MAPVADKMDKIDIIYLVLPVILWPLVFIVFQGYFVYAMSVATLVLAVFSLWKFRKSIKWNSGKTQWVISAGIIGAILLYLVFLAGYYLAAASGLGSYVGLIYSMIYAQGSKIVVFALLAVIGICEEIYWRGGLQGYVQKHSKRFKNAPWIVTTAYYSLVHLSTLNPILVLAAFFVGLITSLTANRYGIAASAIAHILWIEAIIIFLPVLTIH